MYLFDACSDSRADNFPDGRRVHATPIGHTCADPTPIGLSTTHAVPGAAPDTAPDAVADGSCHLFVHVPVPRVFDHNLAFAVCSHV